MNYYNEYDPRAAAWLRALIAAGELPAGEVDERSICDIKPNELTQYTQCHFFAGIGGWSYALKLAGWPSDQPVWTGSCPCQPFSTAGKQLGDKDERHLWPVFRNLVEKCVPPVVFGEQVASPLGRVWLSGVRADLEALGYAVGASDLCAAGVGADHIRQRLYWVAESDSTGRDSRRITTEAPRYRGSTIADGGSEWMADAISERGCSGSAGIENASHAGESGKTGGSQRKGFWDDCTVIPCRDGKARRVGTGIRVLAHGVPGRVGLLRGFGNAIVPQVASEFVKAFCEC